MKPAYIVLGLLALCVNIAVAGGFEAAVRAYDDRHYDTALRLLLPLAEQGHVDAQFRLGMMLDNGLGVPEDPAKARYWYDKACPVPSTASGEDGNVVEDAGMR